MNDNKINDYMDTLPEETRSIVYQKSHELMMAPVLSDIVDPCNSIEMISRRRFMRLFDQEKTCSILQKRRTIKRA